MSSADSIARGGSHEGDRPGEATRPATEPEPEAPDRTDTWVRGATEAVLMVTDEPVTPVVLATALGVPEDRVRCTLADLRDDLASSSRGFELREVAGGWRLYSAPEFADVVSRFVLEGQTARLTQAALETLAVIAYRQPVSRGQVSAVRGVNVDSVVRTLTVRGLIAEVGTEPSSGAVLYGTTPSFLERMGFTSLEELPPLAPFLPDLDVLDAVDPTAHRIVRADAGTPAVGTEEETQ